MASLYIGIEIHSGSYCPEPKDRVIQTVQIESDYPH